MVAAAIAVALANAAAYSSLLFDPIVILLALFTAFPKPGGKIAARRVAILVIIVAVLLLAGLLIGGSSYLGGFERTTLARVPGGASPLTVLTDGFVVDRPHRHPGLVRRHRQPGREASTRADMASGDSDHRRDPWPV